MFRIRCKTKDADNIMCILIFCIVSGLLAQTRVDYFTDGLLAVLWIFGISTLVTSQLMTANASRSIKQLVLVGYALRIVLAILQTYFPSVLPNFMTEFDQKSFLLISRAYYNGDFSDYSTNFPIVLNQLFHITGTGELPSRVLFIYLWFLGFILIEKIAGRLEGKRHWILILFYSLLPWTIYMQAAILRESIKTYSLMLSLFFLWKWMQKGNNKNIVLSVISSFPALWLHNGDVAILCVIFMTTMLWDTKRKKWDLKRPNWEKLLIIAAIVLFPLVYNGFVILFPGYFNGSFSVDNLIGQIVYEEARTNYVPPEKPTNLGELLHWTPYRMFYFWASPTPAFWGSAGDVIAFVADTIPWIVFSLYMIGAIRRKCLGKEAKIAILIFLSFTFIYAWGTRNAGTALRHRDHLLGLFVMAGMMEKDMNNTGDRKKCAQLTE